MAFRNVTLKDVARAPTVHISTASRALDSTKSWRISSSTVERIRAMAEELGYRPHMVARGLKRGTTTTVGVVVTDRKNPFIGPLIRGIVRTLDAKRFVTLVAETFNDRDSFKRILSHLMSRRVDAIITSAARLPDAKLRGEPTDQGLPVVLAVRRVPRSGLAAVVPEDRLGTRLAVEHLGSLGHRVFAQLQGRLDVSSFVDRACEFDRSLAAKGLDDRSVAEAANEPIVSEGRRLMELTLARREPVPSAVFAHNDPARDRRHPGRRPRMSSKTSRLAATTTGRLPTTSTPHGRLSGCRAPKSAARPGSWRWS
jgi:LacI family transcriptional regulator